MIIKTVDATSEKFINKNICDKNREEYVIDGEFQYQYTIEDCVLVRTTDHLPFNHEMLSGKTGHGYVSYTPQLIIDFIHKTCPDLSIDERKALWEKFEAVIEIERNTIHWCINGLVGSHGFNDFSERPFIVIEPLKYHIKDENLTALRAEDTYFTDRVKLSDECVIVINEDIYNQLKNDPTYEEEFKKYNIYLYRGTNENQAVVEVLNDLGYDSFSISSHGYGTSMNHDEMSEATDKMRQFIFNTVSENNLSAKPHFGSPLHWDEANKMDKHEQDIVKRILETIIKELNLGEEGMKKLCYYYEYNDDEDKEFVYEILKNYGFERLNKLIESINNETIAKLEQEKINDSLNKKRD